MTTAYTSLLGLALPVTGELAGQWGEVTNDYITKYLDAAVAGAQTISGTQTAVTLSTTNGTSLSQAGTGGTGSAQYQIINCTGSPASLLTITVPAQSKVYLVLNATSTSQSVKVVGAGPTTGVTIISGEKALIAWNGSDFVKISTAGGAGVFSSITNTGLTSGRVVYSTTGGLETDSASLTFDGTTLTAGGLSTGGSLTLSGGTANGVLYLNGSKVATSGSALTFDGTSILTMGTNTIVRNSSGYGIFRTDTDLYLDAKQGGVSGDIIFRQAGSEQMRLTSTGLGIGTTPSYRLDVSTNSEVVGRFARSSGSDALLLIQDSTTTTAPYIASYGNDMAFGRYGGIEFARFTTTGLGIGTSSPSAKLTITGTGATGYTSLLANGTTTAYNLWRLSNTGGDLRIGIESSTAVGILTGSTNYSSCIGTLTATNLHLGTNSTVQATLDSSGNLGLGVTPNTWYTGYKALQLAAGGINTYSTTVLNVGQNYYTNASGNDTYINNGYAERYTQYNGQHQWFTAASGTAGNAISFTQAMTLDASGRLGLGTTSPSDLLHINGSGIVKAQIQASTEAQLRLNSGYGQISNASGDLYMTIESATGNIIFRTGSSTERARITSGGDVLVAKSATGLGTAGIEMSSGGFGQFTVNNDASLFANRLGSDGDVVKFYRATSLVGSISVTTTTTAYNTSSDYRLKTLIAPVTDAGARIDALEPVEYEWKADGQRARGFFAHKFQAVYPGSVTGAKDAVDENGKPIYQAMQAGTSEVIADLVAELQSLRKRVAQLEKGN